MRPIPLVLSLSCLITLPYLILAATPATAPATNAWEGPPASPAPSDQPAVEALLNRAAALTLINIATVGRNDSRGRDGGLVDIIESQNLKSSGDPLHHFDILLDATPQTGEFKHFHSNGPLFPNPLQPNHQYYLAIASQFDQENHREGVLAWWPKESPAAKQLDAAIAADRFKLNPQFDPDTGRILTFTSKLSTTIQVQKDGQLLWQKTLDGITTKTNFTLLTQPVPTSSPATLPTTSPATQSAPLHILQVTLNNVPFSNALHLPSPTATVNLNFDNGQFLTLTP